MDNLFEKALEYLLLCEDHLGDELYDIEYEARDRLVHMCKRILVLWDELGEAEL